MFLRVQVQHQPLRVVHRVYLLGLIPQKLATNSPAAAWQAVFRIRIHRIHMFLGLPDPDPLSRGMDPDPDPALDPDPSIILQN